MIPIGTPCLPARVDRVEIPKLKTAECTVVEGKSDKPEQSSKGVEAHRVDSVPRSELAEFEVVAFGAMSVPLENCEKRPIIVAVSAAVFAVERGTAEDALKDAPAFASVQLPANHTACANSSEKQMDTGLETERMRKA
jgi:hypothetical protein